MTKLQPRPLKYRELLQMLAPFGVPVASGSLKGPQYPIKHHGAGTELSIPVIKAVLRRFNIKAEEFWQR
jgi:hypothetical protein